MIREAKEEAGLTLKEKSLKFLHIQYRKGTDGARVDFYFTANKWKGDSYIAEPDKCDDLSWFHINSLPDNTIPFIQDIIKKIENRDPYSEFSWD